MMEERDNSGVRFPGSQPRKDTDYSFLICVRSFARMYGPA
jgi:hypothetical protein